MTAPYEESLPREGESLAGTGGRSKNESDMQIKVLAFAQTRQQLGFSQKVVECAPDDTARSVLLRLQPDFIPGAIRVAIDHEYAAWDVPLGNARELALIPPVSGG